MFSLLVKGKNKPDFKATFKRELSTPGSCPFYIIITFWTCLSWASGTSLHTVTSVLILSPDSGKSASLDLNYAFASLSVYSSEPAQASGRYHVTTPMELLPIFQTAFYLNWWKKYFHNTQFWPLTDRLLFSTWRKKWRKAGTRWTKPESAHWWPLFLTCSNHMWCAAGIPSLAPSFLVHTCSYSVASSRNTSSYLWYAGDTTMPPSWISQYPHPTASARGTLEWWVSLQLNGS